MIRDHIGKNYKTFHAGDYGIEIETESKGAYAVPESYFWDVPRDKQGDMKPEQSLRDFGIEYILRVPVSYGQVPEALTDFEKMTKSIKFIKDSISTSVHVHKNILNEKFQTLGNYLTLYALTENILMEYAGEFRKHNLFCLPICDTPVTHKNIQNLFLGAAKNDYRNWFLDINAVKYAALNLGSIGGLGSIEMRQLSGDPNTGRIQDWIDIIERMFQFSRQNMVPGTILDVYRDGGKDFLKDIFGNKAYLLNLDDHENLVVKKRALWYASQIAFVIKDDQWLHLDDAPVRPVFSKEILDHGAMGCFGKHYDDLNDDRKEYVVDWCISSGYDPISKDKPKANKQQAAQGLAGGGPGLQAMHDFKWQKQAIKNVYANMVEEMVPPQPADPAPAEPGWIIHDEAAGFNPNNWDLAPVPAKKKLILKNKINPFPFNELDEDPE